MNINKIYDAMNRYNELNHYDEQQKGITFGETIETIIFEILGDRFLTSEEQDMVADVIDFCDCLEIAHDNLMNLINNKKFLSLGNINVIN